VTTIEMYDTIVARRGMFCEVCGGKKATELHHCLYHRRRGATFLDCEENLELVCNTCHQSGYVNSWRHRVEFYIKQCGVYGSAHMEEWNESLSIKIKQRFV
jgi:hypothetical protein